MRYRWVESPWGFNRFRHALVETDDPHCVLAEILPDRFGGLVLYVAYGVARYDLPDLEDAKRAAERGAGIDPSEVER